MYMLTQYIEQSIKNPRRDKLLFSDYLNKRRDQTKRGTSEPSRVIKIRALRKELSHRSV